MQLVITEKPSVARDIARVLGANRREKGWIGGNNIQISWCLGHMAHLANPDHYKPEWKRWSPATLPMIPDRFDLTIRKGIADHWAILKTLLQDGALQSVVNACDAGREGELIFRYVYQLAGCTAPVQRLWVSSMTDSAINNAWGQMKAGQQYDNLADAARCRAESDWLVGLNATRAMTCLAQSNGDSPLLSIGRVQTPTLAMIVGRDQEIADFVPQPFWQVNATFTAQNPEAEGTWKARWFRREKTNEKKKGRQEEESKSERLSVKVTAQAIVDAARNQEGIITTADRKQTRERPPLLYDLTSLQRRANQRFGFSADKTLNLAQALYEQHKLLTYPRTDARYLTPDQVPTLPGIVNAIAHIPSYAASATAILGAPITPGKRVVNAAEVGDHHAILPTDRDPSRPRLSADEKRLYDLVARRFLAALSKDALFDATTLIVSVPPRTDASLPPEIPQPLLFRARGRICQQEGWRAIDPPKKGKEIDLPRVQKGDTAIADPVELHQGETRPPRPHTDASLLRAMETAGRALDDKELKRAMRSAGLGTPATRASILQTLLNRGYIERKKRDLRSTDRGRTLIQAIPVDEIKSAALTGRWESRLSNVADGKESREAFMADVVNNLKGMIDAINSAKPPPSEAPSTPVLGTCPICGTDVHEGHAAYSCRTGRACSFVVFKTIARRKISKSTVKQLLKDGQSKPLKNFKSKKNKPFHAALRLNEEGRVVFEFSTEPSTARATPKVNAQSKTPRSPVGMTCPECRQGSLIRGRAAWGCDQWRSGCRFVLSFDEGNTPLTAARAVSMIQRRLAAAPKG